jgi:hypothetical protein
MGRRVGGKETRASLSEEGVSLQQNVLPFSAQVSLGVIEDAKDLTSDTITLQVISNLQIINEFLASDSH